MKANYRHIGRLKPLGSLLTLGVSVSLQSSH